MGKLLILLSLLALCTVPTLSANIYFNTSVELNCTIATGGCLFDDPNIWDNNTAPVADDSVFLIGSSSNSSLLVLIQNATSVGSLFLQNVVVLSTASINTSSLYLSDFSSLIASALVQVTTLNQALTANLSLANTSSLSTQNGTFNGTIAVAVGAGFSITGDGFFSTQSFSIESAATIAYLYVLPGVNISFPQLTTFSAVVNAGSFVDVYNFYGGQIAVQSTGVLRLISNTNATISGANEPLSGLGTLVILNSTVSISATGGTAIFNGTLNLGGTTVAQLTNITLSNFGVEGGVNQEGTNLQVTGDGLGFANSVNFLGAIIAVGKGITLIGNEQFILYGSVGVVNSSLTIGNNATLFLANYTSLTLSQSQIYLQGSIIFDLAANSSAELALSNSSSLVVTGPIGTIEGNVVNGGVINVSTSNNLEIYVGNYIQLASGILSVSVAEGSIAPLSAVDGFIELNGSCEYTISKLPLLKSSISYLVAIAASINGTFVGSAKPLATSTVKRELELEYDFNAVHIEYNFHPDEVTWWLWLLFSIGVVLVISIIAFAAYKLYFKRRNYERVV